MEHLMSIRPLTKKAMKLIGETGYCTTSENYAVEMFRLKKLGLHGNGNVVGIGCTDGKTCGWTNQDFINYEQQLIDENLDSDGHAQRTIDRLKEAMVKEKNNG